jgi:hypothetical protein
MLPLFEADHSHPKSLRLNQRHGEGLPVALRRWFTDGPEGVYAA